jgi:plastocyanin
MQFSLALAQPGDKDRRSAALRGTQTGETPMKTPALVLSVLAALASASCVQQNPGQSSPASTAPSAVLDLQPAALSLSASVDFGRDDLGSPFPPPSGHDQSGHSRDSLFPQEVVIDKGGTVTFVMGFSGVHEAAIYAPGTSPKDINASLLAPPAAGCPPVPTINDPNHRIAIVADQVCEGGNPAPSWTFNTPGRYLVICTFLPHFQAGMYGWVTVRDR